MRFVKILAVALIAVLAMVGCKKNKPDGPKPGQSGLAKAIVKEWRLGDWGGETVPFDVYIAFNEDGSFEIFQRLYTLTYERFAGTYKVEGDILTGSYENGDNWKCAYKGEVSADGMTLKLHSQEDQSTTGVYLSTVIPDEVKDEAATRATAEQGVPFL